MKVRMMSSRGINTLQHEINKFIEGRNDIVDIKYGINCNSYEPYSVIIIYKED